MTIFGLKTDPRKAIFVFFLKTQLVLSGEAPWRVRRFPLDYSCSWAGFWVLSGLPKSTNNQAWRAQSSPGSVFQAILIACAIWLVLFTRSRVNFLCKIDVFAERFFPSGMPFFEPGEPHETLPCAYPNAYLDFFVFLFFHRKMAKKL